MDTPMEAVHEQPDDSAEIAVFTREVEALFPAPSLDDALDRRLSEQLRETLERFEPASSPRRSMDAPPAWRVWSRRAALLVVGLGLGWLAGHYTGALPDEGASTPNLARLWLSKVRDGVPEQAARYRSDEDLVLHIELERPALSYVFALPESGEVEAMGSTVRELDEGGDFLAYGLEGFAAGPLAILLVVSETWHPTQDLLEATRANVETARREGSSLAEASERAARELRGQLGVDARSLVIEIVSGF